MATMEEIMLTIFAKDNASDTARKIDGSFQSMASNIQSAMNNMNSGLMNISTGMNNMLSGVTNGKSASDLIWGTTSKAETNKVLINMMTETEGAAKSLYDTVDKVTDSSLTSMQELIPAMNAFKSATGASDKELENVTDEMANFGAAVLAQTGSADLAQQAMMDLSKGIKGAFASLDQYGVSEDALMRTGLWSGKEDDVEGYMAAVEKVIGSTDELMKTNQGLDALIGKSFSRAGKKIGNEFLPWIKDIKSGFIELDNSMGGGLAAGVLVASEGVNMLSSSLFNVSTMINGVRDLGSAFKDVSAFAKNASMAIKGMKSAGDVAVEGLDIASAAAHANGGFSFLPEGFDVKSFGKEVDVVEDVVEDAAVAGALAPEAAAAGAGMEATSVSLGSIATGAMSMLAPLLELAIVVAVMIPIIAGLAAEALLFIKGIQILIDALNFDDIDLSGAIEGIKQVATAMFEVGVAMGAMTFANITTALALLTSGLTGIISPMGVAKELLKNAAKELQELSSVKIDSKIPDNIKSISVGLKAVSEAMGNLTDITWDMAMGNLITLGGLLGNISKAMETAKTEITKAANSIAKMSGLPEIDESAVKKLKSTSESLKSVSDAMSALQDLNWTEITGNLFGNTDVIGTLNDAKQDITDASKALSSFKNIHEIPEGVGKKLKAVADTLKSVSEAISSLHDINWTEWTGNLFGNTDLVGSLQSARQDISDAAYTLSTFKNIANIPEGVGTKLQRVAWTLNNVKTSLQALNNVGDLSVNLDFNGLIQSLHDSRTTIGLVSIELASLNNLANIPDGLGGKLQRITWTLNSVKSSILAMNNVGNITLGSDLTTLKTTIHNARALIGEISIELASLTNIANIDEGVGSKIQRITWTANNVVNTVQALNSIPPMEGFDSSTITTAVTNVQTAATELSKLNETAFDGTTADTILGAIQTTLENLRNTLAAASGFSEVSVNIGTQIVSGVQSGLSPLTGIVQTAVSTATSAAASNGWTGGSLIGTSTTNGFRSALKLASVMTTEMGYVKTAVDNGFSAAKTAAQNGAKEVVEAFKSGVNVGSPGDIARTMEQEMIYTKGFIVDAVSPLKQASFNAARSIVDSFGNPMLNLGSNFTMGNIDSLGTITSRAPGNMNNQNVTIIVSEGAVQLDARNMTTKESRQILITALESLDSITSITTKEA